MKKVAKEKVIARGKKISAPKKKTKAEVTGELLGITGTPDRNTGAVLNSNGDGLAIEKFGKHEIVTVAAVVPAVMNEGQDYLSLAGIYDDATDLSEIVNLCWDLWRKEGIVGSAIETLIDLAITRGEVTNCEDDELRHLLDQWVQNVNNFNDESIISNKIENPDGKVGFGYTNAGLYGLVEDMLLHYLNSGDVIAVENWSNKVPVTDINGGTTMAILPQKIQCFHVNDIIFDEDLAGLGIESMKLKIKPEIIKIVKAGKGDERYRLVEQYLSKDLIKQITTGVEEIVLPPLLTTHIKRKAAGGMRGTPYLQRAFSAIASKRRLQALDAATIAGLIQRVTIIMVGHENPQSPYHIPKEGRIAVLKNALKNLPTQKMLLWNGPDLKVIDFGPDGKVLNFDKRFKESDDGISLALGVPRLLIDGESSGTSSRDWVVILKTVNMLERIRNIFKERIDKWFRYIAVKNNYPDMYPKWTWSVMSLRDQRVATTLVLKAYEDGLIGRRTTINFLGWNAREIIEDHIKEGEEKLNEQIPEPKVSFSKQGEGSKTGRPQGDGGTDPDRAPAQKAMVDVINPLLASYRGIVNTLNSNNETIDSIIYAGFFYYSSIVAKHIENVFATLVVSEYPTKPEWQMRTMMWAAHKVDKFRTDALNYYMKNFAVSDVEKREIMIKWFEANESRVEGMLYGVYRKSQIADKLMILESRVIPSCGISAKEGSCEECKESDGKVCSLQQAFEIVPMHNGCVCDVVLPEGGDIIA